MADSLLRPAGSEITSPLAEHVASLTLSVRGHLVALFNSDSNETNSEHFKLALKGLEDINKLIEPDLFKSDLIDD